jgi:hypothetical protein
VNEELKTIWKEAIVVYSKYHAGICLEELRKTTKYVSQDRQCPQRLELGTYRVEV